MPTAPPAAVSDQPLTNRTIVRIPYSGAKTFVREWEGRCLSASSPVGDPLLLESLLILAVLYPANTCFTLHAVKALYPRPNSSAVNDSSELGSILFGKADVSMAYFNLNQGRRRLLSRFVGPLWPTYIALFHNRANFVQRSSLDYSVLVRGPVVLTVAAVLAHSVLRGSSLGERWRWLRDMGFLSFLLLFLLRVLQSFLKGQLTHFFARSHGWDPLASPQGLLRLYAGGQVDLVYVSSFFPHALRRIPAEEESFAGRLKALSQTKPWRKVKGRQVRGMLEGREAVAYVTSSAFAGTLRRGSCDIVGMAALELPIGFLGAFAADEAAIPRVTQAEVTVIRKELRRKQLSDEERPQCRSQADEQRESRSIEELSGIFALFGCVAVIPVATISIEIALFGSRRLFAPVLY